jgi:hypothetical protein
LDRLQVYALVHPEKSDAAHHASGCGVDATAKRLLWVKARPDYEPLLSILDRMRQDSDKRFWRERLELPEDNCDLQEDWGHVSTGVKIVLQMSDKTSTCLATSDKNRGVRTMKGMHFKSEIAQHQLSDLGRGVHAKRTLSVL